LRAELGRVVPHVEVQYVKFQHNLDQLEPAMQWCSERGVDQFTDYWGNLYNYADVNPGQFQVFGPKPNSVLPQCTWPHFAMTVKYDGSVIPCCYHRVADQYRPGADPRLVGNVFDEGVWGVWNGPRYRQLRRLVSNPTLADSEPGLGHSFCQSCPTIFRTDANEHSPTAEFFSWESLYARDERNRVVRR
jgi:hypothetical protein